MAVPSGEINQSVASSARQFLQTSARMRRPWLAAGVLLKKAFVSIALPVCGRNGWLSRRIEACGWLLAICARMWRGLLRKGGSAAPALQMGGRGGDRSKAVCKDF